MVRYTPIDFFSRWKRAELPGRDTLQPWQQADTKAEKMVARFFSGSTLFNEFSAFRLALAALPQTTALHLANSMAVRYANILGLPAGGQIEVFCNRGTSGIDGCTSTTTTAAASSASSTGRGSSRSWTSFLRRARR